MASRTDQLVKMADQIARNLGAGRDDAAAERTAQHLRRFWTPAMRRQLADFRRAGGAVAPVVAMALVALEQTESNGSETE